MVSVNEEWRAVKGAEGYYEVSSLGRVRSLSRKAGARTVNGKVLKTPANSWGYQVVGICINGNVKYRAVHQLVANAFVFPQPEGTEVNHIDGNKQNNCPENLEWITNTENMRHAVKMQLHTRGEKHHKAKLTGEQVQAIRANFNGIPATTLANHYGVSKSTINRVRANKSWSHA